MLSIIRITFFNVAISFHQAYYTDYSDSPTSNTIYTYISNDASGSESTIRNYSYEVITRYATYRKNGVTDEAIEIAQCVTHGTFCWSTLW